IRSAIRRMPNVLGVEATSADGRPRFVVESAVGQDIREDLASTIVENGWGLLELRAEGMSLEEVFLKLTTREETADE
ncbi:MAG TPA: ABC transporter ATP-binding protein, partial [Chloroflexota bacterium]|nr:ABC transporter ATP-binding protein [Chloroflexota bacterium]